MKLGKELVDRRVKLMEQEGIAFLTNTEVGKDFPADRLLKEFDAVVLATGATKPRGLPPIEGGDLKGIHYAMDFLTANTQSVLDGKPHENFVSAEGKDVVVIGGGDTGTDCVGTSHAASAAAAWCNWKSCPSRRCPAPRTIRGRSGPKSTAWITARKKRWPSSAATRASTARRSKKLVGDDNGQVKEIHTVQIDWQKNDDKGQFVPGGNPRLGKAFPRPVLSC